MLKYCACPFSNSKPLVSKLRFLSVATPLLTKSRLQSYDPSPSFLFTEPPNPSWKLGNGLNSNATPLVKSWAEQQKLGWKSWSTGTTPSTDVYRLLTSAVTPRPIAFVSTVSVDGLPNLAPMSYFSLISHNPPLLTISLSLSPRRPKDTRENIVATKEFAVSIISEPFVEAANACSVEAPAHINEWLVSGLTPEPSLLVKPPWVRESAVSMECLLYHSQDIYVPDTEAPTTTLVLGHIKHIHVHNAVLSDDKQTVDPVKLRPVARLGGNTYSRLGPGFDLSRPSWNALKEKIETMNTSESEGLR